MAYLLRQGVSWEAIQDMSGDEISEFVAVFSAMDEESASKING